MLNYLMKKTAILAIMLIMSLPICFATELSLQYDANGNLVTGDGYYRVYNSLNQLSKVYNGTSTGILLQEYTYDPVQERVLVKKTFNSTGNLTETVYYVDDSFVRIVKVWN